MARKQPFLMTILRTVLISPSQSPASGGSIHETSYCSFPPFTGDKGGTQKLSGIIVMRREDRLLQKIALRQISILSL